MSLFVGGRRLVETCVVQERELVREGIYKYRVREGSTEAPGQIYSEIGFPKENIQIVGWGRDRPG